MIIYIMNIDKTYGSISNMFNYHNNIVIEKYIGAKG